jgi:hypothetical protein
VPSPLQAETADRLAESLIYSLTWVSTSPKVALSHLCTGDVEAFSARDSIDEEMHSEQVEQLPSWAALVHLRKFWPSLCGIADMLKVERPPDPNVSMS